MRATTRLAAIARRGWADDLLVDCDQIDMRSSSKMMGPSQHSIIASVRMDVVRAGLVVLPPP
jgi:hypothetical protein